MPRRVVPLVNGQYYHIFNRGVASMPIFHNVYDYKRFIDTALYYQIEDRKIRYSFYNPQNNNSKSKEPIVDIICYCLMPNHFHFLLKQVKDKGISIFIKKLINSYTKYFNIKNKRVGPLFQGQFKVVRVETDQQLLHLSRYIHLNPLVSYVVQDIDSYPWSSYREYIFDIQGVCKKDIVIKQFGSKNDYRKFIVDHEDYAKELEFIKHQLLDY